MIPAVVEDENILDVHNVLLCQTLSNSSAWPVDSTDSARLNPNPCEDDDVGCRMQGLINGAEGGCNEFKA